MTWISWYRFRWNRTIYATCKHSFKHMYENSSPYRCANSIVMAFSNAQYLFKTVCPSQDWQQASSFKFTGKVGVTGRHVTPPLKSNPSSLKAVLSAVHVQPDLLNNCAAYQFEVLNSNPKLSPLSCQQLDLWTRLPAMSRSSGL